MNPAHLPEYLQPLMKGVADDLTLRQREELAAAIYEFRDVFSSGPTDIGKTGLVKHTIDTGDQRPVLWAHGWHLLFSPVWPVYSIDSCLEFPEAACIGKGSR